MWRYGESPLDWRQGRQQLWVMVDGSIVRAIFEQIIETEDFMWYRVCYADDGTVGLADPSRVFTDRADAEAEAESIRRFMSGQAKSRFEAYHIRYGATAREKIGAIFATSR